MDVDPSFPADQLPVSLVVLGAEQHAIVRFEVGGLRRQGSGFQVFRSGDDVANTLAEALGEGDIALLATAEKIVATAVARFGSLDALVNNAGILFAKPFIEYTPEDFQALSSANLQGFIHTT